ncbi:hypothetical protein EYZ11_003567 [Aspergillus tanneri]|uniref:Aflatoxin regulatory protein domain-containing protein n=1 Tax=Aspergillus tanneri TaxID=1220188 RepID=A0A4S3JMT9_9EURO|nr:hypothetical protein EYZ11_003567 [Aspergillus tanneri]
MDAEITSNTHPSKSTKLKASCTWRQQKSNPRGSRAASPLPNRPPRHAHYQPSDYPLNHLDSFLSQAPDPVGSSPSHTNNTHFYPYPNRSEALVTSFPSPESPEGILWNVADTVDLDMGDMEQMQGFDIQGTQTWDTRAHTNFPNDDDATNCIKRASTVLQSLYEPGASCARSDDVVPNKMQTLDAVLNNNRKAMDTVQTVLDCSCAQGRSVAILLALIMHQVIDSYRTLLTQQESAAVSTCERAPSTADLSGYAVPMAIGQYFLDDEMRTHVVLQVLRSELEKMGAVLDTFARYAQGMGKQTEETVLGTYISSLRSCHILCGFFCLPD